MKWTLHHNTNQPTKLDGIRSIRFIHPWILLFTLIEISYWTKIKQTINHTNDSFDEFIFLYHYKLYNIILFCWTFQRNEWQQSKIKWNEMMRYDKHGIDMTVTQNQTDCRQYKFYIDWSFRMLFTSHHANGCQTLHTDFQILIIFVFAFHLIVKKKNILRKRQD